MAWTQQWQNLQITTGYSQLDNLLSAYGFDTVAFFSSYFMRATLITNQKLNLDALADSLIKFNPSVKYAFKFSLP